MVFAVYLPIPEISSTKLWLVVIEEQDTHEWLDLTLARNDGKF